MKYRIINFSLSAAAAILFLGAPAAFGSTLHSCDGSPDPTTCGDNGKLDPVQTNTPTFTFVDSGSSTQTGDFWVVTLIPNNEGPIANFTVNVKNGGSTDTTNTSDASNLFSPTAWTSNSEKLDAYLGISAGPSNPLGAYLPCVQTATAANCGSTGGPFTADPGATGFFVYVADLGNTELSGTGSPSGNPILTLSTALPLDSVVVGFQNDSGWDATANSGGLYIASTNPVPEPSQTGFLIAAAALFGLVQYRKRSQRA